MEPRNRFQGINTASLCCLAGRYDNPIPTRCLAPKDFLEIPVLVQVPVDVLVISATWGQGALTTLCSTLHVREDKGE
jgi:hypothetical protein